ncbi:MAG: FAD-dependent oxidoreductase, partial [Coriobacteriales bacterium]|nr:FAD-dependent oxidoreductase [Coriobacteriales bacterium]
LDIKRIEGATGITSEGNIIHIGALTKLSTIAQDATINAAVPALAEAAHSVATPLIRNLATIGGNICQDVRCWFYRYPHEAAGRIECKRKGGERCFAILGDNRYHSVYGGMRCGTNPCTQACPAATAIPEYMEQLRLDNPAGAAQILMQVNPLPAITSRVCAHFCQDGCNKNENGESVAIRNVERWVGDYALEHSELFYAPPSVTTGRKVAVVGSGPAGLSAAYYLRQAGCEVVVYDSKNEPGGMLRYAIPAYRLPKDLVARSTAALSGMGIQFVCGVQIGTDISAKQLEADYDSVYYATGTWKRPVLGLAGEELTVFGLDFLVQVHDWMDGKVGSEVLVTGGGNVAMDVAITARRLGAKKVVLACLESEGNMPAGKEEVARAREEGIEIMAGWGLSKVIEATGKITGMELKRCTAVFDENGRFNPVYDEDDKLIVNAENILMAVGQSVDLNFLDERYQLQLTARGLIDVDIESKMTSHEGVFAGGDATTGPSTVIDCIANGHAAARGINRYLGNAPEHVFGSMRKETPFKTFDTKGVQAKVALKLAEVPLEKRCIDLEDETAPDLDAALAEAKRCMNCGCYAVAPSDITPVLVALDAIIHTTERDLSAAEFAAGLKIDETLRRGELVCAIELAIPQGAITHYDKFRLRDAIDFAMYSLASVIVKKDGVFESVRLVLGGAAPIPLDLTEVAAAISGKAVNAKVAQEAAELAVRDSFIMGYNDYKIAGIKSLIKDALLREA